MAGIICFYKAPSQTNNRVYYCYSAMFSNRKAFLAALARWNENGMEFIEVPASCVKKLFGTLDFGSRKWPE